MSTLKNTLAKKIEEWRPRTQKLVKEHGDVVLGEVTIAQALGGMRGVKCLVTDISYLDPLEGIRFRGYTIPEVLEKLPKPPGAEIPYVEGFVYLLLTGDVPTQKNVEEVREEFMYIRYWMISLITILWLCFQQLLFPWKKSHPLHQNIRMEKSQKITYGNAPMKIQ